MKTEVTKQAYNEIATAFDGAGKALSFATVAGRVFVNFS